MYVCMYVCMEEVITFQLALSNLLLEAGRAVCTLTIEWLLGKYTAENGVMSRSHNSNLRFIQYASSINMCALRSLFDLGKCGIKGNCDQWESLIQVIQ